MKLFEQEMKTGERTNHYRTVRNIIAEITENTSFAFCDAVNAGVYNCKPEPRSRRTAAKETFSATCT
jgi:hypothetical protein